MRGAQQGISLLFTLMALVVMGLGAIALVRSVETGTTVIGELGFKQDALAAAAAGTEEAIAWLNSRATGAALETDDKTAGYYATGIDSLDPTGNQTTKEKPLRLVRWAKTCSDDFSPCDVDAYESKVSVNGNTVKWVITRLCEKQGPAGELNTCARPPLSANAVANDRGEVTPDGRITVGNTTPYFRIIVRVDGPRNTVSYTEAMVHF
ncbi:MULTISPECIES: hypothetical protein [Variovorax]|uniref:hypothetical protein n=1 Tax=Variovorax TaxID=34072 RepID=UPI0028673004|nr:hypothetical protein [Variovorax sp. 3319]MDR6890695.1 Tfp pilus assembly protein PilX [Variovorax sp. 3319]